MGFFSRDPNIVLLERYADAVYKSYPYKREPDDVCRSVPENIAKGGSDCTNYSYNLQCVLEAAGFDASFHRCFIGGEYHQAVRVHIPVKGEFVPYICCNFYGVMTEKRYARYRSA